MQRNVRGSHRRGRALASVARELPSLQPLDLSTLEARADEQHEEVEALRVDAFRRMLLRQPQTQS